MNTIDEKYMKIALKEAQKALEIGEVPVGAVIVMNGKIIARGHNKRESNHDPLAHAELIAIKKASRKLEAWRLNECELYVTLEPCPMCAGAIMLSRLNRVIFGAYDEKGGAIGPQFNLFEEKVVNHTPLITGGICLEECRTIIKDFFSKKRTKK